MKILLSSCAALILLGSIGCEMHSPSKTVKVDKEEAAEEKNAQQQAFSPEAADPNAPSFIKNE